jgi:hypothetical protein
MAIIVNDPENLPIRIFQIEMSKVSSFINKEFLDSITERKEIGIKRNNYYFIATNSSIGWLQPTEALKTYHYFLGLCRKIGYDFLMIKF